MGGIQRLRPPSNNDDNGTAAFGSCPSTLPSSYYYKFQTDAYLYSLDIIRQRLWTEHHPIYWLWTEHHPIYWCGVWGLAPYSYQWWLHGVALLGIDPEVTKLGGLGGWTYDGLDYHAVRSFFGPGNDWNSGPYGGFFSTTTTAWHSGLKAFTQTPHNDVWLGADGSVGQKVH